MLSSEFIKEEKEIPGITIADEDDPDLAEEIKKEKAKREVEKLTKSTTKNK